MKHRILLAASLMLVAMLAGVAPAGAQTAGGTAAATIVGKVRVDPTDPSVAYVTASYTCEGGGGHLWISAKQSASGQPDKALKAEGSSQVAEAWLQSHPQDVTCDGTRRQDTWQIDTTEMTEWSPEPLGHGALTAGQAWVQFCLYAGDGAEVVESRWAAVG